MENEKLGLAHILQSKPVRKVRRKPNNLKLSAKGNRDYQRGKIGYQFDDGSSLGISANNNARNGLAMNEIMARKMLDASNVLEAFYKPSTGPYQETMGGLRFTHSF